MSKKSKRNRRLEREEPWKTFNIGKPRRTLAASVLTIVVCLLAYGSSVQFGLTGLDDDRLVSTFAGHQFHITDAFSRDAFMAEKSNGFYRPLQSLTFMADSYIGDSRPLVYHRTNVILHCLAACCLLQLLMLLGYPQMLSLLTTLVYAADPLFAQAVAWIPGRGDLLLGLFGLLSFMPMVKFRATGKQRYLLLHFLALSLAAFSKETALVLPAIFAAYLLLVERRKALSIKYLPPAAVWLTVSVAYFFIRKAAIDRLPGSRTFGVRHLMENLRVLPETVGSFVFPFNISVMPSFTLLLTLTGLAVIAAIAAVLWLQGKQGRPMVIAGCLWFILLSVPGMLYSQQYGSNGYNYLNHRAYLPMIGILLVLVEAVPDASFARRRKEFYLMGGGVVALLCILANRQSASFTDIQAFYDQAIQTNPRSALAYNHRGKFKADAGDFQNALLDYDNALRLYPNYPLAYNNRAQARGSLGDVRGAIDDLTKGIALDPGNALLYSNRGALRARTNDLDGAAADYAAAIARDPRFAEAMYNLGQVRLLRGDRSGACSEWLNAALLQNAPARQMLQKYCR